MICERLSFSNCSAVLREYSRKFALTVELGAYKFSPQFVALDSLAECLIVAAINWIRYGFSDGLLKISIASRMEQPPALAGEYCAYGKERRTE
jgi:hypothetical protein